MPVSRLLTEETKCPGFGYLLLHRPNARALAVNRLLRAGDAVSWADAAFEAGGAHWHPGASVIEAGDGTRERVETFARELGLDFLGVPNRPNVPRARCPCCG